MSRQQNWCFFGAIFLTFIAICIALSFGGCVVPRYTMEQYWPASGDEPGVVVIQWPVGIEPEDVLTWVAMDPVTETTRTLSGVAWTCPSEQGEEP